MSSSELETIVSHGGDYLDDPNAKIRLQYDIKTNELYVNGKKVVTEHKFNIVEKVLAGLVTSSVLVQTVISVLTYLNCK